MLGRKPVQPQNITARCKQKPYCPTTEQVWAVHDAMPAHLRVACPLGAFAGLRVAEAAALRVSDVDFIRGVVTPVQQWPDKPLKQMELGLDRDGSGVSPIQLARSHLPAS